MNKNNHTSLLIIFLFIVMALWLLPTFLLRSSTPYKSTSISIDEPYACEKIGAEWVGTSDFELDRDIFICGKIRLSGTEKQQQIWISAYEGKKGFLEEQVFFDILNISNDERKIPIRTYFNPGSYEIRITDGRNVLAKVMIRVIDD